MMRGVMKRGKRGRKHHADGNVRGEDGWRMKGLYAALPNHILPTGVGLCNEGKESYLRC